VFGDEEGHFAFPCPLLMTSIHFLAQWIFSYVACAVAPQTVGSARVETMSWPEWWATSVPCGLVTSGDVGLSNLAQARMTLSFYTMVKSSTPIFVLGWAYWFGIERITWTLVLVVVIIAAGEYLTVLGQERFDRDGFALCLAASMMAGARWTLVQLKLRNLDPPLKSTIATMRLLSPSMFFSLFAVSLALERPWAKLGGDDAQQVMVIFGLGLLGAFFAICMILCEFYLIMHANAIVLMIGGVLKEMVTIFIGVTFFHDILNRINMSGCAVVFLGVSLYKMSHYMDMLKEKDESEVKDEIGNSSNGHFRQGGSPFRKYDRVSGEDDFSPDRAKENDGLMMRSMDGIELRRNTSHHEGNNLDLRRNSHHESGGSGGSSSSILRLPEGMELRRNVSHHDGSNALDPSRISPAASSPILQLM
jgi:solute carrier family 35, member C2